MRRLLPSTRGRGKRQDRRRVMGEAKTTTTKQKNKKNKNKNTGTALDAATSATAVVQLLAVSGLREDQKQKIREIASGAGHVLDFSFSRLGPAGARALAEALKNSPNTQRLLLRGTRHGPEGAQALADGLKHTPNLHMLNLNDNNICPEGAQAIAEALKHVPNLQHLDLRCNNLGADGARAIADGLRHVPNLQVLYLGCNNLGAEGARVLADGLKLVPNLKLLNLQGNILGDDGAHAISDALRYVPKLQRLDLQENTFESADAMRSIAVAVKRLPNLKMLDLNVNRLGPDGIRAVADAVQDHKSLKLVWLGSQWPGSKQAGEASSAYHQLARLSCLHLFVSQIGPEAARVLGLVFPRHRDLNVNFNHKEDHDAFEAARPTTTFSAASSAASPSSSGTVTSAWSSSCSCASSLSPSPSSCAAVTQLKQQLADKDKALQDTQTRLRDVKNTLRAEAARKDTRIQRQAKELKLKDVALTTVREANQQQAEQLRDKETLIQHLELRIADLEELLNTKEDTEQRTEAILNLNIPPSRLHSKTDVTDSEGNPIAGAFSSLHMATLAGHRVAMKDIRPVKHRPRLTDLLACRASSSRSNNNSTMTDSTATNTSTSSAVSAKTSTTTAHYQRLHREALVLLSIWHPNIVSFLGLSHDKETGTLSFIMSWAEGGSLYDHMHVHKRELTHAQRARIAMEVAAAMQFLHAHGVVHRDLKSPNVLLDESLSAKVTDFGLSAFNQGDDKKTLTHQKGTPLWASPEQLLDEKLYADTDVFSFGVLYWELCFNCKPWHHGKYKGKGAGLVDIANSYRAGQYLPVDQPLNGLVLSATQQQLLNGCFDVPGNRLDFTQLHTALRDLFKAAMHHQQLDETQQTEMLFGPEDAVWKFPQSLLEAVKAVTKQLPSRPSVAIAPLDLQRHVDAVKRLFVEAGGTTAKQHNPLKPFGHTLAAVAITRDKQKEAAFNGALARNKTRYRGHLTSGSSHPFSPKFQHSKETKEPTNEEQKQVLKRVTCGTAYKLLDPSLLKQDPPLRLQRVFHGVTSWGAVVGILGGDFASLRHVDTGYYGTGIYFTPDLDYALKYSNACWRQGIGSGVPAELQHLGLDASKEYRVVLVCDVQYDNPYPVLNAMSFKGRPLMPGHDAHVAVVKEPKLPKLGDAVPFVSHREWTAKKGGRRPLAEIVLDDISCVLVRAVLVFELRAK